jgi:hypothetical protein
MNLVLEIHLFFDTYGSLIILPKLSASVEVIVRRQMVKGSESSL